MNPQLFKTEKKLVESILEPEELISVKDVSGKNEIDIEVIVTPDEYIQSYVRPMLKIGYELQTEKSNMIKLVFLKNGAPNLRLSLEQEK